MVSCSFKKVRWISVVGLVVGSLLGAVPALTQGDAAACENACIAGEEGCFADCELAADIDACEALCMSDADVCIEGCGGE